MTKLICFINNNKNIHIKNYQAIQRMCKSCNIDFETSNNLSRIIRDDYDILLSCFDFIDPDIIPKKVKIIFGPQFFVIPNGPITGQLIDKYSERCVYNGLSNWVKDYLLEFGNFIVPIECFPFSVDTDKFVPGNREYKYDFLVYIKRRSNDVINYTIQLLKIKNLRYKIYKYGCYTEDEYIKDLHKSKSMIVLDAHESQGFALEEAMSCNVPLLVVDSTSMYDETQDGIKSTYRFLKPKKLYSTSVPYWSDECGIKITDKTELFDNIDLMLNTYEQFKPRDYVERTLSDKKCMERILSYFLL